VHFDPQRRPYYQLARIVVLPECLWNKENIEADVKTDNLRLRKRQ
jgi:hypothetical protein